MQARGFLQDCTDLEGLDLLLRKQTVPAYIGFDATADSLHVGSLIQIMMLRWLQRTGHRPIVLMGGGTTKIGDPSGKDETRKLLSHGDIDRNILGIRKIFEGYLDFRESLTAAAILNNADWLDGLNYVEFLRDFGRHFTVNRMLTFDSVRSRLDREQPLSFIEFNYMLLQAYDFMELNSRLGCMLQMGGSDQWGNIVNGVDLTRRVNRTVVYGLTSLLLTRADGSKMGKTASGAVWLSRDRISPFDFWQYWRNTADADTGRFLRLFTELELDECDRLADLGGSEINHAKTRLADEVTALAFGRLAAEEARKAAHDVFGTDHASESSNTAAGSGTTGKLPKVTIPISELDATGISVVQLFVRSGLSGSGKEARRLVQGGGARVDDRPVTDVGQKVDRNRLLEGIRLSAGRKRHVLVTTAQSAPAKEGTG